MKRVGLHYTHFSALPLDSISLPKPPTRKIRGFSLPVAKVGLVSAVKPRILVIRGGAIGDFILTLPAIKLLRENFPDAHIEILGYRHIVAVAEGRFYAEGARSIEYGPMAGFFVPNSVLDPALVEYFASFQQVISYLFDPDGFFEGNLRRAGVKNFLPAYQKIDDSEHASLQLARPLQRLALFLLSV